MNERILKSDKSLYTKKRIIDIVTVIMLVFGVLATAALLIVGIAVAANGGSTGTVGTVLACCSPAPLLIFIPSALLYKKMAMVSVWTAYDIKLIRNAQCNYAESEWLEKL